MAGGRLTPVIRFLRRIPAPPAGETATDGPLLERFVQEGDGDAFALLVRRHGPMVLGVCRRILGDWHDSEDAFQATFLVLARKAGTLARPESLGCWLHGVARRIARKAKTQAARRRVQERKAASAPAVDAAPDAAEEDLRRVLDEEVSGLPARYRTPFILCCLEGRTNAEAARQLGCPEGTIASRLSWARGRLRARLTRRGLAPSAALVAAALNPEAAPAAMPAALTGPTIEAATAVAVGKAVAGLVPARAAALAEGALRAMFVMRLQMTAALVGALVLMGLGATAATSGLRAEERKAQAPPAAPRAAAAPEAPRDKAAKDEAKEEVTLETAMPVVVRTVPEAGSDGVDPKLDEIKVTFSKDMLDQSWSWTTYGKENFPKVAGKPKYLPDKRTAVLPVKLEAGKTYALMINSENFGNFKDAGGRSALPYLLVFRTKK